MDRRKKPSSDPRNRRDDLRIDDFMRIVDKALDGPPGTIMHVGEDTDGLLVEIPDPALTGTIQ